jgi:hypothetical protein
MDGYGWWLILVGMAIALALVWLFGVRLPRAEDDVTAPERVAEAAWISRTIERDGGIAPVLLVEEVLELHQAYLADPRLAQPPVELAGPPPGPHVADVLPAPALSPGPPPGSRPGSVPGGARPPAVSVPRQPPRPGPPAP